MEVKHVCQDCGEVMAVHDHTSYQGVKNCLRGMRALCDECRRYIGCPLPVDSKEGLKSGIPT